MVFEKEVVDLERIEIYGPTNYEILEGKDNYSYRLYLNFTDGYTVGYVFPKITTRREAINTLRELANEIEERELQP